MDTTEYSVETTSNASDTTKSRRGSTSFFQTFGPADLPKPLADLPVRMTRAGDSCKPTLSESPRPPRHLREERAVLRDLRAVRHEAHEGVLVRPRAVHHALRLRPVVEAVPAV